MESTGNVETPQKKRYQKPTLTEYGRRLRRPDGAMNRVLVVDDDKLLRHVLRDSLQASGFQVAIAGDADEALRAIPDFDPDVIVMDVIMPGENGYRACRAIKELDSFGLDAAPKIILLTSRRVDEDPEREAMLLQFSQADAMLYKPCDHAQLMETIVRVLAI